MGVGGDPVFDIVPDVFENERRPDDVELVQNPGVEALGRFDSFFDNFSELRLEGE